ncbi:fructosamine kinase family protein [Aequorivita lipolytica]|uniref:fructosamine kinase family protein n=1 Tax=Aequorivita lipolytica TaxID=153267 RepID=UPI001F38D3AF|nr:fructosamine kinase family protein [Aequorivita lipolytica]
MKQLLQNIAFQNNLQLIDVKPLSGGDINEVFLLKSAEGDFVLKLNDASKFPGMFAAEAKGLQLLRNTKSFKIPNVIAEGVFQNASYLILEYIIPRNKSNTFWETFAENLATLHKTTQKNFGLDHDNYIGSLPQKNSYCEKNSEFYITRRLEPQFKLALANGFHFKNLDRFYRNISEEIPTETPSLIHGDLWNGNFMISEMNEVVLIDPAVSFAPREMDLAMMKLFGGFSEEIFTTYNSIFPMKSGWENRTSLWQLYYLLVHLNLFGSSYLPQVNSALKKYS